MKYVRLGQTGLEVSRICLGCMSFGDPNRGSHAWSMPEDESRPILRAAWEAGINFFDTANVYSLGSSEEIVGKMLKEFAPRDEMVIATKVNGEMRPGPNGAGQSRKAIMQRDRRVAEAAGHRLCRPLPDPPLRSESADRGDAGGAARRRESRQGPLHRRLVDVCVAVREDAADARNCTAGRGSSRCRTIST